LETAKVDIRKLQLLNDRITQCIDALNQVRLSVHGLSHTTPVTGLGALGFAAPPVFGSPFAAVGAIPGAYASVPGAFPYAGGMAHSTGIPPLQAFQPVVSPLGVSPWTSAWPSLGLSHTGPESQEMYGRLPLTDPFMAARIAQTFPYVQYATPPIVPVF
jgi:hypothetical protein